MAEFNELANTPIEMEIAGKKLKVRRVSLDTIFGKAEAAVIAEQRKRIREMAAELEGEERTSFLAKAMIESIPSGAKLNEMCADFMRSEAGVRMVLVDALRADQPDIESTLKIADLAVDDPDGVHLLVQHAIGAPKTKGDGKKSQRPLDGGASPA